MSRREDTRQWVRWRDRRYRFLASSGLPNGLALRLARGESNARERVASVIGYERACAVRLGYIGGPDARFVLIGDADELTTAQARAIRQLSGEAVDRHTA